MKQIVVEKTPIYPEFNVFLRDDMPDEFHKELKNIKEDLGIRHLFHVLIKNLRQKDHTVSSFRTSDEWNTVYWEKYCNDDPAIEKVHQLTNTYGHAITFINAFDPTSDCAEARKKICKSDDFLLISRKYPNGTIENTTFCWDSLSFDILDGRALRKAEEAIGLLRRHHFTNPNLPEIDGSW